MVKDGAGVVKEGVGVVRAVGVVRGGRGHRADTFFMLLPSLGYGGLFTRSQFTGTLIFSYSWKMTSASSMSL